MNHLWKWLLAWAVCSVMLSVNAWPTIESAVDDAFISGRYAAHASEGFGLVFNAGEVPVEGYSNLLWTLWLACCLFLGFELHTAMVWTGLLFGVLALGALLAVAHKVLDGHPVAVFPAAFLALSPHFAVATTNGLETAQYIACMLGVLAFAWWAEGRWRWVLGVALGLMWASRPEGLVMAGLILVVDLWGRPIRDKNTWAPWGTTVLTWAGLLFWRLWVYGAWLPNTAAAKATGDFADLMKKHRTYLEGDWWFWLTGLVLAIVGTVYCLKNRRTVVMWLMIAGSLAIAAQVYLWMPGARLLLLPMTLGFVLMVQPLKGPRWMALTWGMVLAVWVLWIGFSPLKNRMHRLDEIHSVTRDNPAMLAARHLSRHAPEGAWLATRDAGVFAYGVGTGIRVAELHPRALTQPHPGGKDADPSSYAPENPAFFVFTSNRKKRRSLYYTFERRLFRKTTAEYRYLGRVEQHYHRYYDIVVRSDIDIPPLPEGWVVNHALVLPPNRAN